MAQILDNQKGCKTVVQKLTSPLKNVKRKRKTEKYSVESINWQPVDLPGNETKETQQNLRSFLKKNMQKMNQTKICTICHEYNVCHSDIFHKY